MRCISVTIITNNVLTFCVLLSEVGLLSLQLSLSPPLFSLYLLSQTLHIALLLLHALPGRSLLTGGKTGTRLPLELHSSNSGKQTHTNPG